MRLSDPGSIPGASTIFFLQIIFMDFLFSGCHDFCYAFGAKIPSPHLSAPAPALRISTFSFAYARPLTIRPSPPRCHDFCICFASKNPRTAHPIPRAIAPTAVTASVRPTTGRISDLPRRPSLRKSKSSFARLQRLAGNMAEAPAARPAPAAFLADCHRRVALRRHKS